MHKRIDLPHHATATIAVLVLLLICSAATGAQTSAFTYQGRFTDASAVQPTNGSYTMTFRLFDAVTGGNQVPNSTTEITSPVSVVNGVFTVKLDFGAGAFNTSGARFLEIQVGPTFLTPREEITAAPFAIRSINAASADGLSSACVGCVTSSQINSVDGTKITGTVANATTATNAATLTTTLPINKGGTGSTTQNFVDLTTNQTVAGNKTFSNTVTVNGDLKLGSLAPTPGTSQLCLNGSNSVSGCNNRLGVSFTLAVPANVTVTHSLGTLDVMTALYRSNGDGTWDLVPVSNSTLVVRLLDVNTARFAVFQGAGDYRLLIWR